MKLPVETTVDVPHRRAKTWLAILILFVLAPLLGEVFSTSTPLLTFLLDPSTLLWECALYGSGAVLIREIVRRRGLGWWNMLLLGAAYGVLEEGIFIQSWFNPYHPTGLGKYGRLWDTNWIWAIELTIFHAVFSITIPVILTETAFPHIAEKPWLGRKGIWGGAILLSSVTGFAFWYYGFVASSKQGYAHPPLAILGAVLYMIVLILLGIYTRLTGASLPQEAPSLWKIRIAGFVFTFAFFAALYTLSGLRVPPLLTIAAMLLVTGLAAWTGDRWARRRGWGRRQQLALASGAFAFWFAFSVTAFASGLPLVSLIFLGLLIWLARKARIFH